MDVNCRRINSPLTIMAMLIGLAEVAGTVVLVKLGPDLQEVFLWLMMLYHFFLVFCFFHTMNRRPIVFFAPTDFKDERNFLRMYAQNISKPKVTDDTSKDIPYWTTGLESTRSKTQSNIFSVLSQSRAPITLDKIQEKVGLPEGWIRKSLQRMTLRGLVAVKRSSNGPTRYMLNCVKPTWAHWLRFFREGIFTNSC